MRDCSSGATVLDKRRPVRKTGLGLLQMHRCLRRLGTGWFPAARTNLRRPRHGVLGLDLVASGFAIDSDSRGLRRWHRRIYGNFPVGFELPLYARDQLFVL